MPRPYGVSVGAATSSELHKLLNHISSTQPRPYIEAFDLVESRFNLGNLKQKWADAGFERGREILVARKSGRPLAACIMETATRGLHLFGLLDMVRFFPLVINGEEYYQSLLDEARRWYQSRGRSSFVCFLEENTNVKSNLTTFSMYDLGEADIVVVPANLLMQLQEHIFEISSTVLPNMRQVVHVEC